jgi:hypothetical protein
MNMKAWVVICGAHCAMVVACGKDRGAEPATTTTTGALTNDDAMTRLANARCDRETSCNEIGQGKKFANRDACMNAAKQDARSTLRSDQCPRIDQGKLSSCINDIKNQGCNNPIDAIDKMMSCTQGQLCAER